MSKAREIVQKAYEEDLISNPTWDEDAVLKFHEAVELARELFKNVTFSNPSTPTPVHGITATVDMLSLHGAKLKKFDKLVELSEEISGAPMVQGKAFQLEFLFTLCK